MLTAIVPPTTANLMAPETVLTRLKLDVGDLDDITELVTEASGLVARYLRFQPAFGTWSETFCDIRGDRLDLGARPTWSILSVTERAGTVIQADTYRLDRGPFGESSVVRRGSWDIWGNSASLHRYNDVDPGYLSLLNLSGVDATPDWTVQFEAGWWLEEMDGDPPSGIERLPPEIRRDFLKIVRWLRLQENQNPLVYQMRNEGAEVTFLKHKDQDIDDASGLPIDLTLSLALYRRSA